jgi:hypothetical protein
MGPYVPSGTLKISLARELADDPPPPCILSTTRSLARRTVRTRSLTSVFIRRWIIGTAKACGTAMNKTTSPRRGSVQTGDRGRVAVARIARLRRPTGLSPLCRRGRRAPQCSQPQAARSRALGLAIAAGAPDDGLRGDHRHRYLDQRVHPQEGVLFGAFAPDRRGAAIAAIAPALSMQTRAQCCTTGLPHCGPQTFKSGTTTATLSGFRRSVKLQMTALPQKRRFLSCALCVTDGPIFSRPASMWIGFVIRPGAYALRSV